MLALQVIETSNSPWRNPTILMPKLDGSMQLPQVECSVLSTSNAYPMPS